MLAEEVVGLSPIEIRDVEKIRDRVSLFGALDNAQLSILLSYAKETHFDEGEVIFNQGQLPGEIYIVLSGKIDLRIVRDDFTETHLTYVPGDCFGETAVIGIQSQMGQASVEEDARILCLSRFSLLDMLEHDAALFGILMMNIAREVSRRLHFAINTATSADQAGSVLACH